VGNSLNALLDAFQLTADRSFLDKAEELVRRCVHPQDDVAARDLGNVEARWSYTVFLQKLGRYLDLKKELGELDSMFAYARAALLHYARWMVEHEHPYLDNPAVLEFPTETWDAQDLRKSDVLRLAALHSIGGEDRRKLLERARFFSRSALDSLETKDGRSFTRPMAILLANTLVAYRSGEGAPADTADRTPENRTAAPVAAFASQRSIALRRACALAAAALAATAIGFAYAVLG
jgi:hypothetical protein